MGIDEQEKNLFGQVNEKEYMGELKYIPNKNMGIRTHYDSDMGFGAGLVLNYLKDGYG